MDVCHVADATGPLPPHRRGPELRRRFVDRSATRGQPWSHRAAHPLAGLTRAFMSLAILLSAAAGLVAACLALARVTNLAEAPRPFLALSGPASLCYPTALWRLDGLRG